MDERDRPLLIAPSSDAFPLRKKAVCAVLCDRRGRAFVRRRMSEEGMETWDISAETFVRSGEAREEAVERAVRETLGPRGWRFPQPSSLPGKLSHSHCSLPNFREACLRSHCRRGIFWTVKSLRE